MAVAIESPAQTAAAADWEHTLAQADRWAREALGEYAAGKEITWDVVPGRGGEPPAFRLSMAATGHVAAAKLSPDEVTDRREVRWQALRVWGQLCDLQLREGFGNAIRGLGELAEELPDAE